MKINELYQSIINDLKNGKRPLVKLNEQLLDEIYECYSQCLSQSDRELLMKVLCILDNTQTTTRRFEEFILKSFDTFTDSEAIIFLLGTFQKQVAEARFKDGHRLEMSHLQLLERLLEHDDPEVVEWTLRIIESIGSQGLFFKKKIFAMKPNFFERFNKHRKAIFQIIEMLEKRWGH